MGVAQLVERRTVAPNVVGSNPISHPNFLLYSPDRSLTERSEDILYTFGPKGLFKGCRVFSSKSI